MKLSNAILLVAAMSAAAACTRNEQDVPTEDSLSLLGTVWQWQAFQDSADGAESNDVSVSEPADYTLTLEAGNAAIRADCNSVSWSYELDGSSLSFDTLGPSTLAYCGDDSLDRRYLALLGDTVTYVLVDKTLYLNLRADAGNMIFSPAE